MRRSIPYGKWPKTDWGMREDNKEKWSELAHGKAKENKVIKKEKTRLIRRKAQIKDITRKIVTVSNKKITQYKEQFVHSGEQGKSNTSMYTGYLYSRYMNLYGE